MKTPSRITLITLTYTIGVTPLLLFHNRESAVLAFVLGCWVNGIADWLNRRLQVKELPSEEEVREGAVRSMLDGASGAYLERLNLRRGR